MTGLSLRKAGRFSVCETNVCKSATAPNTKNTATPLTYEKPLCYTLPKSKPVIKESKREHFVSREPQAVGLWQAEPC